MRKVRIAKLFILAALVSSCSTGSPAAENTSSGTSPSPSPSNSPSPSASIPVAQQGLDLDPVPFFFAPVDATGQNSPDWMSQLSVFQSSPDDVAAYTAQGILAVVSVYYTPLPGGPEPTPVFSVQYMPENVYADFQNMNGPQEVGNQVITADGNVVAIFGPQGDIYDPGSIDQQIVNEIVQMAAYNPQSYQPTIN